MTRTAFLTFIAFLLIARGLPEGWAVLSVPLILTGGMAGKYACGVLAERMGVLRTIVVTEVATGAGILLTLALPAVATFFLLPLIGVVLQGTSSVIYGTIGDPGGTGQAAAGVRPRLHHGRMLRDRRAAGLRAMGDAIGIEKTIAMIGAFVLLSLPLALVLRPSLRLSGSTSP
jgi:hypothetical protein